jgi:hypothetical protein
MFAEHQAQRATHHPDDVPVPIVTLSRWIYVVVLAAGLLLQQPWLTTLILALVLPPVLWGRKWNLIGWLGRKLYGAQLRTAEREDRSLIHFNNVILVVLLGLAQPAFWLGYSLVGWVLTGMVIAAAGLALVGFCIGCIIYYQFKIARYQIFGRNW